MSAAALAFLAAAFNLVCTGTTHRLSTPSREGIAHFDMAITFRIDLEAQRYCLDRCNETMPIARITPSEIILADGATQGTTMMKRRINRESGRYWEEYEADLSIMKTRSFSTGQCERAPFGGFPARKF